MITDLINFISDPANTEVLYFLCAFLFLLALLLHVLRTRVVIKASRGAASIGGDNSGIVVTGKVKGDVTLHREATRSPNCGSGASPQSVSRMDRFLDIASKLSGVAALVLAALTYFKISP
jgi:hypothetical protein